MVTFQIAYEVSQQKWNQLPLEKNFHHPAVLEPLAYSRRTPKQQRHGHYYQARLLI